MKGSKVYIADMYKLVNLEVDSIDFGDGCEAGTYNYDTVLSKKNVLLIKSGNYYTPIFFIKNYLQYLINIRSNVSLDGTTAHYPWQSHLYSENSPIVYKNGEIVLKNIQPYFSAEEAKKHISLRTIKKIQEVLDAAELSSTAYKGNDGTNV